MAFEADCGLSMVLEEIRVTSTSRSAVPGDCWATNYLLRIATLVTRPTATALRLREPSFKADWSPFVVQASRLHVRPGRPHHKGSRQSCGVGISPEFGGAANSKFEIHGVDGLEIPNSEFRIPNSFYAHSDRQARICPVSHASIFSKTCSFSGSLNISW